MAEEVCWLAELEPELKAAYQAPGRAYHNWEHIAYLLAEFHRRAPTWRHPAAVETAIYWHDVIYLPGSATNEADSAALMRLRLVGREAPSVIDAADALIRATAAHEVPTDMDAGLAADCARFLDMDMSILGAPPDRFDAYDAAIRSEFAMIPDEIYRPRRADVLAGFLARDALFLTDAYRRSHDAQARANLRRAISRLSQACPEPGRSPSRPKGGSGRCAAPPANRP